jgi:hypothetical protein
MKKALILLALAGCAQLKEFNDSFEPKPDITLENGIRLGEGALPVDVSTCQYKVHNRGTIPKWFIDDVIAVANKTPDWVFAENSNDDIYSSIKPQLGPWKSLRHRKAAMVNVVLVAAGFESSWDYGADRDKSASNTSSCTREVGILQSSGNSNHFSKSLGAYQQEVCNSTACDGFRACSKAPNANFQKEFPVGHFMRLVRFTIKHHGPLASKKINPWLKKSCVSAIEKKLK